MESEERTIAGSSSAAPSCTTTTDHTTRLFGTSNATDNTTTLTVTCTFTCQKAKAGANHPEVNKASKCLSSKSCLITCSRWFQAPQQLETKLREHGERAEQIRRTPPSKRHAIRRPIKVCRSASSLCKPNLVSYRMHYYSHDNTVSWYRFMNKLRGF